MQAESARSSVIGSALWAAAGDALGWTTELASRSTLMHRTGQGTVEGAVDWRRRIGGRFGPTINFDAGTYSDDTQLRLAVSRAIGSSGSFDVEAFAKIELPVWMSYSLGAGRGTTAAALNLAKSSANWFSNFFHATSGRYTDAGGNGACMRIQPHVWKADTSRPFAFMPEVIRDAIVTHGHPKGFLGAVFHALCLAYALDQGGVPPPAFWLEAARQLHTVIDIVKADEQLSLFWLPVWETEAGQTLKEATLLELSWALDVLKTLRNLFAHDRESYEAVVNICGGFDPETRGAGLNTAIIASALAWMHRNNTNEEALVEGANAIGSDTDTIVTMTGALLGAVRSSPPDWPLQDKQYIEQEAARMFDIRIGQQVKGFRYPDLMSWSPPSSQVDAVGEYEGSLFVKGLGRGRPFGEVWKSNDAEWQRIALDFGQTVLAKRRFNLKTFSHDEVSVGRANLDLRNRDNQAFLFNKEEVRQRRVNVSRQVSAESRVENPSIDALTAEAISAGFEPDVVGRNLIRAASSSQGIEAAIAYAAIIAKALQARGRRRR